MELNQGNLIVQCLGIASAVCLLLVGGVHVRHNMRGFL